jgi:hypothetical protein
MARLIVLVLLASASLYSQQTSTTPDCQSGGTTFAFTGNTDSAAIPARSTATAQPCVAWRVTYEAPSTVTALTVTLQGAPDNGSGAPGTFVTFAGAVDDGTNPMSVLTTGAFNVRPGASGVYYPWVRIHLTAYMGTGTINTKVLGYRGTSPAPPGASSVSSVNVTQVGGVTVPALNGALATFNGCNLSAEVALSGTGYTTIVAASGSTVIYICKLAVTGSSGGNPVVTTFTMAQGVCAGAPTELQNMAGVTGLDSDYGGSLRSAAGAAFCAKESVANSDKVTVTYAQF